jgi:3-hydroxybutyryl-CoA dehydrogenase
MSETESSGARGWPRSTVIIGAGTMGLGVAESFAVAGTAVRLTNATPESTREAYERLMQRIQWHAEVGLLEAEAVDRAAAIETADDISAAVRGTDLVFEAVPEDLDLKHEILAVCADAASPEAVIVSNTSSLPMDELATSVERPERFLGMHWFNPPE